MVATTQEVDEKRHSYVKKCDWRVSVRSPLETRTHVYKHERAGDLDPSARWLPHPHRHEHCGLPTHAAHHRGRASNAPRKRGTATRPRRCARGGIVSTAARCKRKHCNAHPVAGLQWQQHDNAGDKRHARRGSIRR